MRKRCLVLFLVLASVCLLPNRAANAVPLSNSLHIMGNHFVLANGQSVRFIGVNRSSLEYSCQGDQHFTPADFAVIKSWNINLVRLPLSAPEWLNENNLCPDYQQTVAQVVANAESQGLYILLTLAYVSPFGVSVTNPAGAGYDMAPRSEAVPFWQQVATQFNGDPRVMFDLYSEPHDITWSQWKNGGQVTQKADKYRAGGTYPAVGMQELAELVSDLAPQQLIVVSGNEWGGDLTGPSNGYALSVPNMVYGLHLYPGPHNGNPANWAQRFGNLAAKHPVLATEFGQLDCGQSFIDPAMAYMRGHLAGMTAWTWNTGDCQRPSIANFDGTPTPYGQAIHDFYLAQR